MMEKEHSKLFTVDKEQIKIFIDWHHNASHKNSAFKEVEIMADINETEWYHFCNRYIGNQTNNTPSHQTRMVTPSYSQDPKLKVSIK